MAAVKSFEFCLGPVRVEEAGVKGGGVAEEPLEYSPQFQALLKKGLELKAASEGEHTLFVPFSPLRTIPTNRNFELSTPLIKLCGDYVSVHEFARGPYSHSSGGGWGGDYTTPGYKPPRRLFAPYKFRGDEEALLRPLPMGYSEPLQVLRDRPSTRAPTAVERVSVDPVEALKGDGRPQKMFYSKTPPPDCPSIGKMGETFEFLRPPEAPTFCPSEEEWADPLGYINKIRPKAETYGICKIRPPTSWQPPFAVDVDSFKFTPRVQRLNELEAPTRIKLNFLDQIAKFFELQGTMFKIPMIEKKALDLYTLHALVAKEGGMEKVNSEKKWNRLAIRLGLPKQKNYGPIIRTHFEKILYPFVVFQEQQKKAKLGNAETPKKGRGGTPLKGSPGKKGTPTKGAAVVEDTSSRALSAEVRRLAFYGPGPKMAGYVAVSDPLAQYVCLECGDGESEDKMLLCDGCDDSYHTFCLNPPLTEVPKGEWRCPRCVAEDLRKPGEAFGFEQATREYTLSQFGQMADAFKADYFNMPLHKISPDQVELEFWRIVSAIDEDVTVEYGADLHTMDHGSGFPTGISKELSESDVGYVNSGWNLNNLPNLEGSVLGHISADISGMKVPWMYVGMMFSTFCWHNEDHWSYSINYLHWGEAKTWYGVPGQQAPNFEEAMKKAAPELFQSQPDLLHQLVTIMNPNILMRAGVPVYRMDQEAGEFIITFPRAYHAGFNQGYNFAEAVNFAPADWLPMGRECVEHYSNLHRYCVFSHDELICAMASNPERLDMPICLETYQDFKRMVTSEFALRKAAHTWGVMPGGTVLFENLNDDERLCDFCKTTSYLSCITCDCTKERQVCLRHYDKLCDHPAHKHQLKVRYGKDELLEMARKLFVRVKPYLEWIDTLKLLTTWTKDKPRVEYEVLKSVVEEGLTSKYPGQDEFTQAQAMLRAVDKMKAVVAVITGESHRTRNTGFMPSISLRDLGILMSEMAKVPINMPEITDLHNLHASLEIVRKRIEDVTHADLASPHTKEEVESLSQTVAQLPVGIPEVEALHNVGDKLEWLEKVNFILKLKQMDPEVTSESLGKLVAEGRVLGDVREVATLKPALEVLFQRAKDLEKHLANIASATSSLKVDMAYVERTCEGLKTFPAFVPNSVEALHRLGKSQKALREMERVLNKPANTPKLPFAQLLEKQAQWERIPVAIGLSEDIKLLVESGRQWKAELAGVFLKTPPTVSLMAALTPKLVVPTHPLREKILSESDAIKVLGDETYRKFFGLKAPHPLDLQSVQDSLNERADGEALATLKLRARNYANWYGGIGLFCVCQQPWRPTMLRCECCYDWYHPTCVPICPPSRKRTRRRSGSDLKIENQLVNPTDVATHAHEFASRKARFLGPCCCRSARPSHDQLVPVIQQLGALSLEFPEGLALLSLTRRAITWHDSAAKVLAIPGLQKPVEILKKPEADAEEMRVLPKITAPSTGEEEVKAEPEELNGAPAEDRPMVEPLLRMDKAVRELLESVVLKGLLLEINGGEREDVLYNLLECTKYRPVSNVTLEEFEEAIRAELEEKNIPMEGKRVQLRNTAGRMANQTALLHEGPPKKRAKRSEPKKESQDIPAVPPPTPPAAPAPSAASPAAKANNNKAPVVAKGKKRQPPVAVKRRTPRKVAPAVKSVSPVKAEAGEEEEEEAAEDEEVCSAVDCLRPATTLVFLQLDPDDPDNEVLWVMCESCNKWFHVVCVGLTKRVVERILSYLCEFCCEDGEGPVMLGSVDGEEDGPVVQALQAQTTNVRVKEELHSDDSDEEEEMEEEEPPSLVAASELRGRPDKENAQMAKLTPQRKAMKEGGKEGGSSTSS